MATRKTTRNISVRRKRDYSIKFEWSTELNNEVHRLYQEARCTSERGYMQRLKDSWDREYPMYANINKKQLRQQATFVSSKIERSKLSAMSIECRPDDVPTRNESATITPEHAVQNGAQQCNLDVTAHQTQSPPMKQACSPDVLESLRASFSSHFNAFKHAELSARKYVTRISTQIPPSSITAINQVLTEALQQMETKSLWELNCLAYSAALTVLERHGKLRENKRTLPISEKKAWITQSEQRINSLRRKISQLQVIISCKKSNSFTPKQKAIANKLRNSCGSLKLESLEPKLSSLKHELRVQNTVLKERLVRAKRSQINKVFATDQKRVYRQWRDNVIEAKKIPNEAETEAFWSDIWNTQKEVALDRDWYCKLQSSYCSNASQQEYKISTETIKAIIKKMPNNKAPGKDLIVGFWIKNLPVLHEHIRFGLASILEGRESLPPWLATSRTILIPKNSDTHLPNNYRPIACQNTMYKLYTGILNGFLEDHCAANGIIMEEQTGGRKGTWGCTDQLLINKMVLDEVRIHQRSLLTMWFDYRKAFDSVPHKWIITSLELAKVPRKLITAIEVLMKSWATQLYLQSRTESFITNSIPYKTGILQGDCLAMVLFIMSLNPLSFLLSQCSGYKIGEPGKRDTSLTHLLFVDDLKTFDCSYHDAESKLRMLTQFTTDIGMNFGSDKCAYLNIERGKIKTLGKPLVANGLTLRELKEGEPYKYLGTDEDIRYKGALNKENVKRENGRFDALS